MASATAVSDTIKKGGSDWNRLRYLRFVRGTWPPESPAKPYLKVSCNSVAGLLLLKHDANVVERSQKYCIMSIF